MAKRQIQKHEGEGRGNSKRERVLHAAVAHVYAHGFCATTLADIAKGADVPLGSVFYYLKTKEEFGTAVVEFYEKRYRELREQWSQLEDPRERLEALVRMTLDNRRDLVRLGCPIGSLSTELRKSDGAAAAAASRLFTSMLEWLEQQFVALGRKKKDAAALALQLLAALEGATLVAHSVGRVELLEAEASRLIGWLETI